MKIKNSYKTVQQHTLYKPTIVLEHNELLVTELNDPNVSYDMTNEIDNTQIKSLRFSCSIEDFNKLPPDMLASCKKLIKEYPNACRIKFLHFLTLDPSYLDLLIDSRQISSNRDDATICFNLMKSIYFMKSNTSNISSNMARHYMPQDICDDISRCIYSYIKNNGYSKFVNKFQQHFESEQSYGWAVKGTTYSFLFAAACCAGLVASLDNIGYHSSALGAGMLVTIPAWYSLIFPEFSIKNGEVNFESAIRRVHLTNLYKDIGGKIDYQLWEDHGQSYEQASLSMS